MIQNMETAEDISNQQSDSSTFILFVFVDVKKEVDGKRCFKPISDQFLY